MDTLNPLNPLNQLARVSRPFQSTVRVDGAACLRAGALTGACEAAPRAQHGSAAWRGGKSWWTRLVERVRRIGAKPAAAPGRLTRRQRRALQGLDARTLVDIGVDPEALGRRGASDDARWLLHRSGGY